MAELRAGGMALIIRSTEPSDVGKCVTLVSLIEPEMDFVSPSNIQCTSGKTTSSWLVVGDVYAEAKEPYDLPKSDLYGWGLYKVNSLLPIDGEDFSDEDIYEKDIERDAVC